MKILIFVEAKHSSLMKMSVFENKCDFHLECPLDIEKKHYCEFEMNMSNEREYVLNLIENGFNKPNCKYNGGVYKNQDNELKILVERNKQLLNEVENTGAEINRLQAVYENFKRDREILFHEIKETHEAFLMAKKYYKKVLKMYYTIELRKDNMHTIFIQFFTESKKDSENYSIHVSRDSKTGKYELINTNPKLQIYQELQKKLQDTNDIAGVLWCIRQAFIAIKKKC